MTLPLYNIRFLLLVSASFITIFSSIAIYFCLPILISHVMRTQISLSPTSGSYDGWRLNSVIDRFYLYNLTNLDDIVSYSGSSIKPIPKFKQLGPFTYRQDREKVNIKFDTNNETVLYDQIKRWSFLPELSSLKTSKDLNSTYINHVNIPLAGTTLNPEYAEFIDPIVSEFDLKLFLNHSVNILLTEGYFDILMEQAKQSGQIEVDKFGWLYDQNNSISKNIRVFTGPSNVTLDKLGSIDQFNFKSKFNVWQNECDSFKYVSAGEFFPPPEKSIISHNNNNHQASSSSSVLDNSNIKLEITKSELYKQKKAISLFMPDLCRTFRLYYSETLDYKGLTVDRYVANQFTYDYTNPMLEDVNRCYCIYNETTKTTSCPPNGMMDLFTCKKGSPLTISFPHFRQSLRDRSLTPYLDLFEDDQLDRKDNVYSLINSDDDEYKFYIDLESTLNIPIRAQIVLQFNVHLRNEPSLKFFRDYSFLFESSNKSSPAYKSQDLYLPQMWFKSSAQIDDENLKRLKFIQKYQQLVTPITTVTFFAVASILLMMSAKLAYDLTYGPKSRSSKNSLSRDRESCSSSNNQNQDLSLNYMEEKQKYYAMQLLDGENSNLSANRFSSMSNFLGGVDYKPTTSRKSETDVSESQPLNQCP